MLRAPALCLMIVAALPLRIAAAPMTEAPVPASAAAAASMLGLDPAGEPARFLSELIRLLYTPPPDRNPPLDLLLRHETPDAISSEAPAVRVPVPLTAQVWSEAVFRREVTVERLVGTIVADRRAALLCYALTALDDETLAYLSRESSILTQLYETSAPAFAAFGPTLRISGERVVPSGGEAAAQLWETLVGESVSAPTRFVPALFREEAGRLPYLYDTIAQLDSSTAAFALGFWIGDEAARLERFRALAAACLTTYGEWQPERFPFSRPLHDLAILLMRIQVDPSGAPASPSSVAFWTAVFRSDDLSANGVGLRGELSDRLVDAGWIVDATAGDVYRRGERLDQIAFGQRVFGAADPSTRGDVVVALRAFPVQRMPLLTLERMGVTAPAVYAAAARRTRQVSGGSARRGFWRLAQFQSAFALVARMTMAGTIAPGTAESLVMSLCAVPLDNGDRYSGRMARWLEQELLPLLPDAATAEERVIAGLAGASAGRPSPAIAWEGQRYRLDFAASEIDRLRAVRGTAGCRRARSPARAEPHHGALVVGGHHRQPAWSGDCFLEGHLGCVRLPAGRPSPNGPGARGSATA